MRQRKVRADTTTRGMIHSILPEPGTGRIWEITVRSGTHTQALILQTGPQLAKSHDFSQLCICLVFNTHITQ